MLSLLNENKVVRFFDWWVQGLRFPFYKGVRETLVVDCQADQVFVRDSPVSPTKSLSNHDRSALRRAHGSKAYLRIPDKALISTTIPSDKRHLSLLEIAATLLPFDSTELLLGSDSQKSKIYAVLEGEVKDGLTTMRCNDIPLAGMAIVDQGEFRCIAVESLARSERGGHSAKPWLLAGTMVMIMILAAGLFWYAETREQRALRQALVQYQTANANSFESDLPSLVSRSLQRKTGQSYTLLRNLLDALPDGAVVDQLILTESELVLDMRAPSASLVKSELDASRHFLSSEFVSAISSDRVKNTERFRLQLRLVVDRETRSGQKVRDD